MPIYDYKCPCCHAEKKDEFVTHWEAVIMCECTNQMDRQFPLSFVPDVFPSEGLHLKHVCPQGKTFYSKSEMKRYAKEHNLELGALL